MDEKLQIWVFCEGCRRAHEVGYADLFETSVQKILAQDPPERDDIYFFVGVVQTIDI